MKGWISTLFCLKIMQFGRAFFHKRGKNLNHKVVYKCKYVYGIKKKT